VKYIASRASKFVKQTIAKEQSQDINILIIQCVPWSKDEQTTVWEIEFKLFKGFHEKREWKFFLINGDTSKP